MDLNLPDGNNFKKMTLLQLAVNLDRIEAVNILLEHGAEVNTVLDSSPMGSPLYIAAQARASARFIPKLLQHGADPNHPHDRASNSSALASAISAQADLCTICDLSRAGAAANTAQGGTLTPLSAAVEAGATEVVRLLLVHGAESNSPLTDTNIDL